MEEKTIKSKEIYKGKVVQVYVDEVEIGNQIFQRELIKHPGGVAILAQKKDGDVLCVRQYRYGQKKEMLELPAGKLEYGEDPFETGKRELQEETGYKANSWVYLGEFVPTGAYLEEKIYMYYATDLEFVGQHLDQDEFIQVESYPIDKLVDMIMDQTIIDGKTIAMTLKVKYLRDLKKI